MTKSSMIVTQHPLSAEAGGEILRKGGNAVDAAVGAAFASCVVEPMMNTIGGGGFMIIQLPRNKETAIIDFSGVTPARATDHMFEKLLQEGRRGILSWRSVQGDVNLVGSNSVIVPGTVAGLCMALEKFGTLPLSEVMQPAINYAEKGFEVNWFMSLLSARNMRLLCRFPATANIFLRDGFPLRYSYMLPGEPADILVQADLGATLRKIAENGADIFYRGEIADRIAGYVEKNGGLLTNQDLANYKPEQLKSNPGLYRGHEIIYVPSCCGGPTLIQMLNILEHYDLARLDHNSSQMLHLVVEGLRLAFIDRFKHMADPKAMQVPLEKLTSKEYAQGLSGRLDLEKAGKMTLNDSHSACTSHLSVVDQERNLVSLTQTVGSPFGSGVTIPETGILMHNGMLYFNPEPGLPNSIGPKKKPLVNMTPIILLRNNEPYVSVGSSGGRRIISAVAQVLINLLDFEMSIDTAIRAPQISYDGIQLIVNQEIPASNINGLRQRGHEMISMSTFPGTRNFASVRGISVDSKTGKINWGADQYIPNGVCMVP